MNATRWIEDRDNLFKWCIRLGASTDDANDLSAQLAERFDSMDLENIRSDQDKWEFYVRRSADRGIRELHRSRARRKHREETVCDRIETRAARSPEDALAFQFLVDAITEVLDTRSIEILRMRFELQMTATEIGDRLGITPSYVRRLLRRSLATLRTSLELEQLRTFD